MLSLVVDLNSKDRVGLTRVKPTRSGVPVSVFSVGDKVRVFDDEDLIESYGIVEKIDGEYVFVKIDENRWVSFEEKRMM